MPDANDVVVGQGDAALPAVASRPEGTPKGGVVVIQEIYGLTPHIRNICSRLAEVGYLAVAPALFHRQGAPVFAYDELDKARPVMGQLNHKEIMSDLRGVLGWLEGEGFGPSRTGIIGFCMGGSVATAAASQVGFGASVSFYGGGVTEGRFGFAPLGELAPGLKAPWLGLFGDLDGMIPVDQVELLREQSAKAAVPTEVVRYAEAGHGFNCDDRTGYEPRAAADAWSRTIAWLDEHVSSS